MAAVMARRGLLNRRGKSIVQMDPRAEPEASMAKAGQGALARRIPPTQVRMQAAVEEDISPRAETV